MPYGTTSVGMNFYYATFDGDGDVNDWAVVEGFQLTELALVSNFTVRSSGNTGIYTAGDQFSPHWLATAAGMTAPQGVVTTTLGTASCSAPVGDNTCTLTVPDFGAGSPTVSYTVTFVPTDFPQTPTAVATGTMLYGTCQLLVVQPGSYTIDSGRTCGASGVLSGSVIALIAPAPRTDYALDYWSDGDRHYAAGQLQILSPHVLFPVWRYAPVCYTLNLFPNSFAPTSNNVDHALGIVESFTPPNCADPRFPSDAENALLAQGEGRCSAGTTVLVHATSNAGAGLTLDHFEGVDTVLNNGIGTVLMTGDRTVIGHFKPSHCLPVPLVDSAGGTVTIVSSERSDDPVGSYFTRPVEAVV